MNFVGCQSVIWLTIWMSKISNLTSTARSLYLLHDIGFRSISPVVWRRATQNRQIFCPPVSQSANICFSSSTLPDKSSLSETRFDDCAPVMMIAVVTVNSGRVSLIGQSESQTHSKPCTVLQYPSWVFLKKKFFLSFNAFVLSRHVSWTTRVMSNWHASRLNNMTHVTCLTDMRLARHVSRTTWVVSDWHGSCLKDMSHVACCIRHEM